MNMAIPVRMVIFLLVLCTAIVEFWSRTNINVAMVSMVRPIKPTDHKIHDVCPIPMEKLNSSSVNHQTTSGQRFDWSPRTQGIILGAFYYSHVPMHIPIGRIAELFGGRWILVIGLAGSGLINLVTPTIAHSVPLLVMSRMLLGFCQCGMQLSSYQLLCKWLPIKERSTGIAFLDIGTNLGVIISSPLTGYLSEHGFAGGWPSAFYVPFLLASLISALNYLFLTSRPQEHKLISKRELELITQEKRKGDDEEDKSIQGKGPSSLPWKELLSSGPVLVAIIARFSLFWAYNITVIKLPAYMSDILHVSPTKIGFISSIMFITSNFTLAISGYLSERLIERKWLSRTETRKLFVVVCRLGMAACLFLVPSSGCDEQSVVVLLVSSMFFYGLCSGGDLPIPAELSSHFPATILALICAVCGTCGFIVPYLVGVLLEAHEDIFRAWSLVFYISSGISLFCAVVFVLYGSAERQSWDYVGSEKYRYKKICDI